MDAVFIGVASPTSTSWHIKLFCVVHQETNVRICESYFPSPFVHGCSNDTVFHPNVKVPQNSLTSLYHQHNPQFQGQHCLHNAYHYIQQRLKRKSVSLYPIQFCQHIISTYLHDTIVFVFSYQVFVFTT